jgi:CubicO group peptidase (beta-lactamase class C family)
VLDSPWVLVPCLVLVAATVGYAAGRLLRRRARWLRLLSAVLVALAVALGLTQAWARLMLDRSAVARALVWMDADVDDWRRFPAAPIRAGDRVLPLREQPLPERALSEVTLPDGSTQDLAALLEDTGTTSFLVLRDDVLLVEAYPLGGSREDVATSFSMAKSILSTALGIAVGRGEVSSVDDPVTDYVPELRERGERFARITLRHLVSMSSGLRYEEAGLPWSDDAVTYYSPDLRATALSAEVVEPPGRRWLYNNYNPLLLGLVLERATGRPLAEYVAEHLWQPLGAEYDASWSVDSEQHRFAKMESGFNARPVDYARFGYLFAHEGRVGGRQVVPADWVSAATAREDSTDPVDHYQWFWWVDTTRPNGFMARGNKGQLIYVDPAADVVVVRTGRDFGIDDWPAVLADVVDRVVAPGRSGR